MQPTRPVQTNLFLRNDTILGICEAIGQDFGFHPNWLRLLLASTFYFSPLGVTAAYLGLGVLVAVTRWFAPDQVGSAADMPAEHRADNEAEQLPLAA